MASNGNGGLLHLAGELFKMIAGIEYIKTGKVRALAVTTPTRSEVLPDVPPLSEFVPGYDAAAWIGVSAPKNTPPEIIDKLNKEVNAALADPKLKLRLADLGSSVASPRITGGGLRRKPKSGAK